MKFDTKILLLFLILFFTVFKVNAVFRSIDNFSQVDGLPCNAVNHIFEDSRGIIWLATDAGMCEFNGYQVKYRKELNRLQGERINYITEDENGNLLIAASGIGICQFDGDKLKVVTSSTAYLLNDFKFVVKQKDRLIVGTSNGILCGNQNNDMVLNFESEKLEVSDYNILDNNVLVFPKLKLGSLKLIDNYLQKLSPKKPSVIELGKNFEGEVFSGDQVIFKSQFETLSCDVISCITGFNEKYILLRYFKNNEEQRKLILLKEYTCVDYLIENQLHEVYIQTVFKHKLSNEVWLGTKDHGIIRVKHSIFSFVAFNNQVSDLSNIEDLAPLNDGSILLATRNSIAKLCDGEIVKIINQSDFNQLFPKFSVVINEIEKYGDTIWIATNHGFFTLNINSLELMHKGIVNAQKFIVLSSDELFCYSNNQFVKYNQSNSKSTILLETEYEVEVTKMIEFNSKIWVSTRNQGIYCFGDKEIQKFGRSNCGFHNVVNDMLILPDSCIIAGGNNGILYKLKNQNDNLVIVDSLDSGDGLQGISVHGFQYINDGSIWCGTNLGIHRFDYDTWHTDSTLRYHFWNSAKDMDFRGIESVVDKNGFIWVNSKHTLLKIEVDKYDRDRKAFPPSLLNVKIKHNSWKSKKSELDKWTKIPNNPIYLDYNENYVSFKYGMLYCDNPDNIRYRYRLLGLEKDWSDWQISDEAVYSNLKDGNYVFELEARKLSNDKTATYSIRVKLVPAWWQTLWFKISMVIIIGLLIYYIIKKYQRKIRIETKQRTKQYYRAIGMKIKSLQFQLNPHFVFNSLNSIQSYILDGDEDKALEYLSDFSMILRNNINNANKNLISLADELTYLKLYLKFEQMRFEEKFMFQISVDDNINPVNFKIPPMLIQPFLEHAIKNGINKLNKPGNLNIRFLKDSDLYLICEITDNGAGNRQECIQNSERELTIGNSLQITSDRMKLLNRVLPAKIRQNGRKYSYQINEIIESKTKFTGVKTVIFFPKL